MEPLNLTTKLLGLEDPNIDIKDVVSHQSHMEIKAKLDYKPGPCPHCQGKMIKYDFQKPSTIPLLDMQGMPTVLKLKKRRFQCKECRRVVVSETSVVRKNCQISQVVWKKITDLHIENLTSTAIARRLHISVSVAQRRLEQFAFKESFTKLPEILSIDEFSRNKGQLAFIAQDFESQKLVTILEDTQQSTIKTYFYQYPLAVREQVKVVTVDMSQSYIPLIKQLFPKSKIVIDRFHIIQHLGRAMMTTRIAIMKEFEKGSLPHRAMKIHWKLLQKDSRKLSQKSFYSRTFRQTLTPREAVEKILAFSDELRFYYKLYQLLLFHFQEKRVKEFFGLIEDNLNAVNSAFEKTFKTFRKYRDHVTNALELPYSNAKLEATNKLIKDIKRQAFGFKNFKNFKTKILIALNIRREKNHLKLSRC